MNRRTLALGLSLVSALLASAASAATAAQTPTFDLYTSSVFAGTGNMATCRVVNAGLASINVTAQLVDVDGNVLAAGAFGVQPQRNGALTGYVFSEDFAGVYCRFRVANPKQVRASLTLLDGSDSAADTIAVAEGR